MVAADNKKSGAIACLNRRNGKIIWKVGRPKKPNYASPVIYELAGRQQLIMTGCDLVSSYNPVSGDKLWEIKGATTECVTTTVTDGIHVYSSGGYPKNHASAIRADGSGKVVWRNQVRVSRPFDDRPSGAPLRHRRRRCPLLLEGRHGRGKVEGTPRWHLQRSLPLRTESFMPPTRPVTVLWQRLHRRVQDSGQEQAGRRDLCLPRTVRETTLPADG